MCISPTHKFGGRQISCPAFLVSHPQHTKTLSENKITLTWLGKLVLSGHTKRKGEASQLQALTAGGKRRMLGTLPLNGSFSSFSTQCPSSQDTYNLAGENLQTLFARWTSKIKFSYSWAWLLPLPLPWFFHRQSACSYCLFLEFPSCRQRKRADTHEQEFKSAYPTGQSFW